MMGKNMDHMNEVLNYLRGTEWVIRNKNKKIKIYLELHNDKLAVIKNRKKKIYNFHKRKKNNEHLFLLGK